MTVKQLPSPELLRQLLRYEPETGKLFWRERVSNRIKVGDEAGCASAHGYKVISICGKRMPLHRVAFALHHQRWPIKEIDHINGVRSDNRECNLREVSATENRQNTSIYSNNKSGQTGVFWNKATKSWRAKITVSKKVIHIGLFENLNEAIAARKKAEAKYGFHPNHGRL